jgi:hypothetical protein
LRDAERDCILAAFTDPPITNTVAPTRNISIRMVAIACASLSLLDLLPDTRM